MFELKEPTQAKLKEARDKGIKIGQRDLRHATCMLLEHVLPNTALEMFDPELRAILYGPGSPGEKVRKQKELEGLDMVQDLPSLTLTGSALATLNWTKEQSGCELTVKYGTGTDRSNLSFKDGTVKDVKLSLLEGGAVKVRYKYHAPDDHLTNDQLGQLHKMHQRDVTITLTGPQVDDNQTDIEDESTATPPGWCFPTDVRLDPREDFEQLQAGVRAVVHDSKRLIAHAIEAEKYGWNE
jgi:hypothetical protein